MAANVEHDFNKYFELDEEKLRRIHSIVKKRVNENGSENIKFRVTRLDNLIYSTDKIDEVINEENDSISKITSIEIYHNYLGNSISIAFKNKTGVSIKITGEDRDNVFLLSSELKEYINKEISTYKYFNAATLKTLLLLAALLSFGVIIYKLPISGGIDDNSLKNILENQDVNEKLNFIVEQSRIKKQITPILLLIPITLVFILIASALSPLGKIIDYFFPRNTFMIGKQISSIEKRRKLKSNIFWIVCVGGMLSLALTYLAPKLFN